MNWSQIEHLALHELAKAIENNHIPIYDLLHIADLAHTKAKAPVTPTVTWPVPDGTSAR